MGRIGIVGPGLGGYYAARTASAEGRIRAVSMIGSPYTLVLRSPQTREKFMHAAQIGNEEDAHRYAARFTLEGLLHTVKQPLLVIHGRQDTVMPWEDAQRMANEAPNGELRLYPDGGTACHTVHHLYKPYLADWMKEKLGA
jgi:pimeloyl-ACP methyl ester carboxylesterase